VNPAEATRCGRCRAPLPWGDEVTDAPRPPVGDFSLPRLPEAGPPPSLAVNTATVLVILCILLGLVTFGIGFVALPVLIPVFVRLARKDCEPDSPFRLPALTGCAAQAAAAGIAFLVLASAVISFVAVCYPIGVSSILAGGFGVTPGATSNLAPLSVLAGVLLGAAAAMGASYLVARRFFPPDKGRREGGEP
jgi:hypothetical protein